MFSSSCVPGHMIFCWGLSKHGSRAPEERNLSDLQPPPACRHVNTWPPDKGHTNLSCLTKEPSCHLLSSIFIQIFYTVWSASDLNSSVDQFQGLVSFHILIFLFALHQLHPQPENPRGDPIREPQQKASNLNQMCSSVFIRWLRS